MHDSLTKHAAQLARLAMMIRIGLESAESAIPGINDQLAELATRERGVRAVFAKPIRSHPPKVESYGFGMGLALCPLPKSSKTTRPGVIRTHDQGIMSGDEPEE